MQNVEWGEYELRYLFDSYNGNVDIQKQDINGCGEYVVTAGLTDSGILGKTDMPSKVFDAKTITVDMFGFSFYRPFRYKMVTHARVFNLVPKFNITDAQGLFIVNSLHFLNQSYGYENMCSWAKIQNKKIRLPIKNESIDFDFMESFIAELEAERIAELEAERIAELSAYLTVSGLDNYELSDEERKAVDDLKNVIWGEYKMGDLFEKITTNKLPHKAKDLPETPTGECILPCLTSSFKNQGLNYFAPKTGATVLKHVITIPQNSDVYRAYYQSADFTVLSDAYAIKWQYNGRKISRNQYLFMVMCINKVTDLPIYSYKNKLGGWNVVKEKYIRLPQTDGQIDFEFMQRFVSAIQKLAIKDVVLYTDKNIKTTEAVVSGK